jgi:hypothetical protein
MSLTPRLQLPYLAAGQAQKHVTLNEALRALDALCQLVLKSTATTTPPPTPTEGDCYAVPAGAGGAWTSKAGQIAGWFDGGWQFFTPREGWLAWVDAVDAVQIFKGGTWRSAVTELQNMTRLGIGTMADATTRFAVNSAVSRFDQEGGNHRMVVNKTAPANTASLVFQTGYSGRAEFGLTGSDAFQVKVSADGTAWHDAMSVSPTQVTIQSVTTGNLRLMTNGTGSLRFGTGGTERLALDSSGHFVPLADNVSRLGGAGARFQAIWSATGTIQTSDAREKIVESPLRKASALALLDAVEPVLFRWKQDAEGDSRLQAGFLAQDIKAALVGAGLDFGVWGLEDSTDHESRQWLRPDQLIPVLWAALKETRNELQLVMERLAVARDA